MGIWGSSLHRVSFENAAHRARNHHILVRSNDANPDPAGVRGNHPRSLCIARLTQFNPEESQSIADALCANMTETSSTTVISEQGGKENQHDNDERFCPACNASDGSFGFDIG